VIAKLRGFLNTNLRNFPYPVLLINDAHYAVLTNSMAKRHFKLNEHRREYLLDYIEESSHKVFFDFITHLSIDLFAESAVEFKYYGEHTIIGKTVDTKHYRYYLLVVLPSSFYENYKLLKQKYDAVMAHVSDSIIVTDENQKILEVNNGFSQITGFDSEEVLGRFPTLLSSGRHDENFYRNMFMEMYEKGFFKGEITDRKKNGEIINGTATIIPLRDEYDDIKHYVGILNDMTEVLKLRHVTHSTKNKDILTGVHNRESIVNIVDIKAEMASVKNQLAILFIDLNKFKQVNDTFGHRYGDFVLSSAANRMKSVLRANDLIGRYGGDEFIIMLERVNKQTALEIAKKVQNALSKPYVIDEQVIEFISGSIGVAFAPSDSKKAIELIEKADMAMYQAKKDTKNEHIVSSDNLLGDNSSKTLKTELLHAIKNDEFYVRIQPIISVNDGKIVGGEILSRWLNLHFNEVLPSVFISLLQSLGMVKKFDLHILSKTLFLLEEYKKFEDDFFININISAEQFSDVAFIDILEEIAHSQAWLCKHLVIEITESAMMVDMEKTTLHLNSLRALGFKVAIDDFGTGFSSLSYLKHFVIDYLKVDKSFVDNIEDTEKDVEILKAIISLAKAIDAKVIVEGVERKKQFDILKKLEVDYIQGFYFYKPILPELYFSKIGFEA
jgi:diguanylate cyclase (GGDEF)-like protein/PAS domain S-box-containing protein